MRYEFRQKGGQKHLYLVESERTAKGPRRTRQLYVGTADALWERILALSRLKSHPMGKPLALIHAARETGLLRALERHLSGDAEAVARLVFLQILGRVERPLSREGMAKHFSRSPVPALLGLVHAPSSRQLLLSLRRLFGTGARTEAGAPVLSRARVRRIEADVFRSLLEHGLDPRWLIFDTTNHYTHHQEGRFPRKGKSKERRADKNLLGLGLVTAGPVPVMSEVYPGNEADPKVFFEVFQGLVKRLEALEVATERMTLVFDRGVNSTENFDEVVGLMHVIAALDRQQARRLLAHPISEFRPVGVDGEGKEILGFSTHWEGFERIWRVLVTYRAATAFHQQVRWERTKARVLERVAQWSKGPGGRREQAVMAKLVELIPKDYRTTFDFGVEKRDRNYWPRCTVNAEAEGRLRFSWGKTAIITDLSAHELSDQELVKGWVGRGQIEEDFRWLKDRYVMSVKPVWVWNDEAVPGHVFLCVMGLMLLRFLQWEARDLKLSVPAMLDALAVVRGAIAKEEGRQARVALEPLEGMAARLAARWHLKEMLVT